MIEVNRRRYGTGRDRRQGRRTAGGGVIGLITVTAAGQAAAGRLERAWPGETRGYPGPAAAAVPRAWTECEALVCFLATGAAVRLIAPLLAGKHTDPAVVCVDEAARHAIALVGGHASGANGLAARVAGVLGADPVLSTATDAAGLPGLDTLGWPAEGAVAAVSRAMLDGEPVRLDSEVTWPLPAFPPNVLARAARRPPHRDHGPGRTRWHAGPRTHRGAAAALAGRRGGRQPGGQPGRGARAH